MSKPKENVSLLRHQAKCSICTGDQETKEAVEREFICWKSPKAIATDHGLADRATIYRHAHAMGLMEKRRRNVRAVLESILERSSEVWKLNASDIVAAAIALGKLNAAGQFIERRQVLDLNALFEKMSVSELEEYAQSGELPKWFRDTVQVADGGEADPEEE